VTQYRTGRDFEHSVRQDLVSNGYEVIRSAGSKTKVDLFAWKTGESLFIQCKRDGKISPIERTELIRLSVMVGAVPVLAYKTIGRARVLYQELTGPGPRDRREWQTDQVNT
jgi:Holliday junction resolvase